MLAYLASKYGIKPTQTNLVKSASIFLLAPQLTKFAVLKQLELTFLEERTSWQQLKFFDYITDEQRRR